MSAAVCPFPGMDPFLESTPVFRDFHDRFIATLSEMLQPALPQQYYAALGQRAWIEVSDRCIGPDVNVARVKSPGGRAYAVASPDYQTVPLKITEPIVIRVPHEEFSESLLEIYVGRGDDRRLVTAIELLSLTNKTEGQKGRDLYLKKQAEILDSSTHLIEIDLLHAGMHTTAVPERYFTKHASGSNYHVCAHYFDHLGDYRVYPVKISDMLPTIAVPLLPKDGSVVISLQQVFEKTYAAGAYDRQIDYANAVPEPPLSNDQLDWLKSILAVGGEKKKPDLAEEQDKRQIDS